MGKNQSCPFCRISSTLSWFSVSKEAQRVSQRSTCLWSYRSWLEKTTSGYKELPNHCYSHYHRPPGPWEDMQVVSVGGWLWRGRCWSWEDAHWCVWAEDQRALETQSRSACGVLHTSPHLMFLQLIPPKEPVVPPGLQGLRDCNSSCCGMLPAVLHSLLAISTRTLHVTHTQISQFSSDDVNHHWSARTNCPEPEFMILSCLLMSCSLVVTEPEPFVRNARMLCIQIHSLWWASTATKQYLRIAMLCSICLRQSLRPHWDLRLYCLKAQSKRQQQSPLTYYSSGNSEILEQNKTETLKSYITATYTKSLPLMLTSDRILSWWSRRRLTSMISHSSKPSVGATNLKITKEWLFY